MIPPSQSAPALSSGAPESPKPATLKSGKGVGRRIARARRVLAFAVYMARQSRLLQVAASLTFSSILALVPLLAVVLAVLTVFPLFGEMRSSIEQDLAKSLLPVPYAQTILRYLTDFAAKAAGVGVVGLALLAGTALSMILTVDRILNDIWQVHQRRTFTRRLFVYLAVLSIGPVLLVISLSLTSYVVSLSDPHILRRGSGFRSILQFVPPLIAAAAYSLIYKLVPYRAVAWRHAVTGGLVTAVADELMSRAFAAYVIHGSFLSIYGAFAAFPIFLTWIYLSWLSFLFGAAIAATLPRLGMTRFSDSLRAGDQAVTAIAVIKLLFEARRNVAQRAGGTLQIAQRLRTYEEDMAVILHELEQLGYARRLPATPTSPEQWVLAADPQTLRLGPVFARFAIDPKNSLLHRPDLKLVNWLAPAVSGAWLTRSLAEIDAEAAVTPVHP